MRKLIEKYREIISYLFWGVMTTVVSWGSYSLFSIVFVQNSRDVVLFNLNISMAVFWANILSWICAVLFAFITNKLWVFHSKSWKTGTVVPEFGKFLSARLATGILEIVAVPFLVGLGLDQTIFGIEGVLAKIVVSVVVVIINYIFSKLFVFKK